MTSYLRQQRLVAFAAGLGGSAALHVDTRVRGGRRLAPLGRPRSPPAARSLHCPCGWCDAVQRTIRASAEDTVYSLPGAPPRPAVVVQVRVAAAAQGQRRTRAPQRCNSTSPPPLLLLLLVLQDPEPLWGPGARAYLARQWNQVRARAGGATRSWCCCRTAPVACRTPASESPPAPLVVPLQGVDATFKPVIDALGRRNL